MVDANRIIELMKKTDYEFFGLRKDDFNYNVGDSCNISHQLFQDPMYDDEDELIYPYCEDGIYQGYYDAGELNGTSAIEIDSEDTLEIINKKIKDMSMYFGNNLYLIAGNNYKYGNDYNEIIISGATVVEKLI